MTEVRPAGVGGLDVAAAMNAVAASGNKSDRHHATFFQRGGRRSLSLAALDARAHRLAQALREAGLQPGERIGVIARNSLEWVLLDLAAVKAGLVTAGFEFGKLTPTPAQMQRYELKALYSELPLEHGLLDLAPLVRQAASAEGDPGALPAATLPAPHYRADDCTTLKFTSGSTGEPKGLAATVGSIGGSLAAVQQVFNHTDGDNLLVFLPLSLLQQRYWVYSALLHGHDVTVASFEYALQAARDMQPTVVMGVPGFFEGLKRQVERDTTLAADDLAGRRERLQGLLGSRVRYLWTGSAPASPGTLAFFDDGGFPLFEGYGMNETCIVTKNHPGAHRRGSVGRPMPGKHLRLDDDGVLVVGSDHPVNTAYRYCGPGDNERTFLAGGEVRTGDLARIDEDGYLYILGRADDVLVLSNGKNVHTRVTEEHMKQHPAVADCVLFGSGMPYLVAVVSPGDGLRDAAELQEHIQAINAGLPADERIVKTFVAPQRFSVESGLLTSQFKPRRKEIFKTYRREIDQLYGVIA